MEVVESPLNLAHQQSRKADRLLAAGKFEEAIVCHGKAADLLKDAMTLTECEQARLSLELQRDSHVKQQRLIEEKWKRSRREAKPRVLQPVSSELPLHGTDLVPPLSPALDPTQVPEWEYDTWLYLLKHKGAPLARPPPNVCPSGGMKAQKDDKTRLEEQETTIGQLRQLVDTLMGENERLRRDSEVLRSENERLRRRERELEQERDNERLQRERNMQSHHPPDSDDADDLWVLPQRQLPSSVEGTAGAAMTSSCCREEQQQRRAKDIAIPSLPPLEMPNQELALADLPGLELPDDIQQELQQILDAEKL